MNATNELARNTAAVILAGGRGTRLDPLTRHICKPALPFGGAYRNIDFSLANCVNSGVRRIGVATQHAPAALLRHIDEAWRGAATGPGEFIAAWHSEQRAPKSGYRGTADAVFRNLDVVEKLAPSLVLVLSGDHVYRMDYRPMLEYHCEHGADVTVAAIEVPVEEANRFGILSTDQHNRIRGFVEKPKNLDVLSDHSGVLASMGVYVFGVRALGEALRRDAFSRGSRHDFGHDILPSLIHEARVYAFPFRDSGGREPGYWRDVGTPAAYWRAHLELLNPAASLRLDDAEWPLSATAVPPDLSARYAGPMARRASDRSLVAHGAVIDGTVRRSVVFAGACVSPGSHVEASVILPGAQVGRDCRLQGVIVDSHCRIPAGTLLGPSSDSAWARGRCEPIVVTAEDFWHGAGRDGLDSSGEEVKQTA